PGHAVGALARRPDQASRPSQDEYPRVLRRSLYAVPQARRTLRQASPHVGGTDLRGGGLRLRPALGHEVRLSRCVQMGMGGGAEEIRVEARRLYLHSAV